MSQDAKISHIEQISLTADKILENELFGRHSMFQLQCFILAKEPTIQGKLHQCLLEIKSRKQSLDAISLEIEEQLDDKILCEAQIQEFNRLEADSNSNIKKIEIEVAGRKLKRKVKSIDNSVKNLLSKQKDISEETLFFCTAFNQLSLQEKLKSWDDPDVQKQYWDEKLRTELNTRLLLKQLPDLQLMSTILCLHDDSILKKKCIEMLKQAGKPVEQKNLPENK